jgi:hypothetical protein
VITSCRPPARNGESPLRIPALRWSPEARRFLEAAIAAAEDMKDWWLEEQAIWLERQVGVDDD